MAGPPPGFTLGYSTFIFHISLSPKRHPHTPTDRLFCSSALPTKNFSKFPAQMAPGPAGGAGRAGQAGSEALTTASCPEPLV